MRRPAIGATCAVAILLLVAGCDGDDDDSETESTVADRGRPPADAAVKACANCSRSRAGRVDLDSPQNIRAGPLILYFARQYAGAPRSEFSPVQPRGRLRNAPPTVRRDIREQSLYLGVKLLLLVEGSRAATLEVPPAERAHASLLYVGKRGYSPAERRLGLAQVADGHGAVRFEPFRKGRGPISEFPGGLVVAGARCLPLDVWVEGSTTPIRRTVSFGVGDRC